ncbi:hypothetical protein MNR01_10325 [Lysobacter sp. S4-A87]|uniref:hypothetical protein n=1 Tax=Lysobacter sp. S4-A87 TaxID=2925843 RepID=UPI001F52FB07|nr:hypothetical protein [Lysobacter sp. S4-A87]UNK48173.1 hypothetical protein MNR01_10325 [Lysobacter sp. S4-A87]
MDADGDLDLASAARLLGDAALVPLVVDAFATSAPPLLAQLRQRIVANDEAEVRRHLHRLTPTLALLAGGDLQDQCGQVFSMWHAPRTAAREARSLALVDRLEALVREAAHSGASK